MTFTGGTTGMPKGAVVSHRARYVSGYTVVMEHELTGEDVVAVASPLYHAIALMVWYQGAALAGCTCVLRPGWNAPLFVDDCQRHGITAALLVPVQIRAILDDDTFDAETLGMVQRTALVGGAVQILERLVGLLRVRREGLFRWCGRGTQRYQVDASKLLQLCQHQLFIP